MGFFQLFLRSALLLCLTVLPFLLGKAALQVAGRNRVQELHMTDAVVTGWILCIGTAEAVHLAAVFLKRPFSDAVKLLAIAFVLLFLAAVAVLLYGWYKLHSDHAARRKKKRLQMERQMERRPLTVFEMVLLLGFVLLAVYQMVTILETGSVYRTGDLTVETVESFIGTDAFYQVNPLTGREYELGIPLRLKILCLPTLYAFFCKVFGMTAIEVVWEIVPMVVLFGSYLVFYGLAECFFPGSGEREKRVIFMLLVAGLFCVGDYRYGVDGFGLIYSGFRGVTIRNAILLPYTMGQVLRRRWKTVVLCVLAEACIVWTLYGMGACLLAALLMLAVGKISREISRKRAGSGEEAQTGWKR